MGWITLNLRTSEDKCSVNNLQLQGMNLARRRQQVSRRKNCEMFKLNNRKNQVLKELKQPKESAYSEYNKACDTYRQAQAALENAKKNIESAVKVYGYSDGKKVITASNEGAYRASITNTTNNLRSAQSFGLAEFIDYMGFPENSNGDMTELELAEKFHEQNGNDKEKDKYSVKQLLTDYADKIKEYREQHPDLEPNTSDAAILKDYILPAEIDRYEAFRNNGEECYKIPCDTEGSYSLVSIEDFESGKNLKPLEDAVESAKTDKELKYSEYNIANEEYESQKLITSENFDLEAQLLEEETTEEENQLDMEQTEIETQLEAMKQELESVKQGVSQGIQGTALKFA